VAELAELLHCLLYTAVAGTADEKEELLQTWLACPNQLYLVATSALGASFDYTHVRLVMYVDEPHSLVDFAQESG
jgi:superfamily II DNA helicase RecQ